MVEGIASDNPFGDSIRYAVVDERAVMDRFAATLSPEAAEWGRRLFGESSRTSDAGIASDYNLVLRGVSARVLAKHLFQRIINRLQ
jgi:hypothetical protein